ncbi:MAG: Thioredoxin reductase, partial [uncultured Solirubrobacteraceae bacterium]
AREARRDPRHHGHRRRPGRPGDGVLGRHARGVRADRRLAAADRRPAHRAVPREVDLRRARPYEDPGEGPRRGAAPPGARAVRRAGPPRDHGPDDRVGGRHRRPEHEQPRLPAAAQPRGDHRRRPRRLRAQEAAGLRHDAVGGPRSALPRRLEVRVHRQEGADHRRRRLGLRLGHQPAAHRRVRRALPSPRGLSRPRADRQPGHVGGRRGPRRPARPVPDPRGDRQRHDRAGQALSLRGRVAGDRDRGRRDPAAARLQDRARAAEGLGPGDLQGRARGRPRDEDQPARRLGLRRHHDLRGQAQAHRDGLRRVGGGGRAGGSLLPPRDEDPAEVLDEHRRAGRRRRPGL